MSSLKEIITANNFQIIHEEEQSLLAISSDETEALMIKSFDRPEPYLIGVLKILGQIKRIPLKFRGEAYSLTAAMIPEFSCQFSPGIFKIFEKELNIIKYYLAFLFLICILIFALFKTHIIYSLGIDSTLDLLGIFSTIVLIGHGFELIFLLEKEKKMTIEILKEADSELRKISTETWQNFTE